MVLQLTSVLSDWQEVKEEVPKYWEYFQIKKGGDVSGWGEDVLKAVGW